MWHHLGLQYWSVMVQEYEAHSCCCAKSPRILSQKCGMQHAYMHAEKCLKMIDSKKMKILLSQEWRKLYFHVCRSIYDQGWLSWFGSVSLLKWHTWWRGCDSSNKTRSSVKSVRVASVPYQDFQTCSQAVTDLTSRSHFKLVSAIWVCLHHLLNSSLRNIGTSNSRWNLTLACPGTKLTPRQGGRHVRWETLAISPLAWTPPPRIMLFIAQAIETSKFLKKLLFIFFNICITGNKTQEGKNKVSLKQLSLMCRSRSCKRTYTWVIEII